MLSSRGGRDIIFLSPVAHPDAEAFPFPSPSLGAASEAAQQSPVCPVPCVSQTPREDQA